MTLQTERLQTVEQIRGFLDGNGEVGFTPLDRDEAYGFVRRTLVRLNYDGLEGTPTMGSATAFGLEGTPTMGSAKAFTKKRSPRTPARPDTATVSPRGVGVPCYSAATAWDAA